MVRKCLLRVASVFLSFALVIQMIGPIAITVHAENEDNIVDVAACETNQKRTIVSEVVSERDAAVKHFRMSDGTFTAVSYGMPVHFLDNNGEWQDINNIPVMVVDAEETATYQISNAESCSQFSTTLEDGHLLTSSYAGVSVQMSILDTIQATEFISEQSATTFSMVSAELVYNRNATAQLESGYSSTVLAASEEEPQSVDFMPSNLESSILYEDVFPGIDIRYTNRSNYVKEEIIVHTLQDAYSYAFNLQLNGLTASQHDDGSISLLNEDEVEVYYIPAPYMIDAAGAFSNHVYYEIQNTDDGIVLIITADQEWIEDEERVLPVSIDPTISTSLLSPTDSASDDIYATYAHPEYATSSLYGGVLFTGFHASYPNSPFVTYLYVNNLPVLPVGSIVSDANLCMYMNQYSSNGASTMPIGVYSVTDSIPSGMTAHNWVKGINYNNKPAYNSSNVIDYVNTSYNTANQSLYWNITELAKGWYAGNMNRMLAVAAVGTYASNKNSWQRFQCGAYSQSPIIEITYRNNFGIEDYYTYQSMSTGKAGMAYISDSTGQLKVAAEVLEYSSSTNPFSLNLIYNSDYCLHSSATYYPPSVMGLNMNLGSGWTLDCIQTITNSSAANNYLEYRDGDGTIHYFKWDSIHSQYNDEDGLGLSIASTGTNSYRLFDTKGNYSLFSNGLLTEIKDYNNNRIYINYSNNRITTITQKNYGIDPITIALFEYSGNTLSSITDAAGNEYSFAYTNNRLTAVKKNSATVAQYSYSGNRLTGMTDTESGYSLQFGYYANTGKISGYSEDVDGASGAAVTVIYPDEGCTTYIDHGTDRVAETADDLLCNYLFDYAGRTINSYIADDGGNIYGATNAVYSVSNSTDKTANRLLRTASIGITAKQMLSGGGFEQGGWTLNNASVSGSKPRTGSKSLSATSASASSTQYASKQVSGLTSNKSYTFSGYVNTSSMSFSGKGLYLVVKQGSTIVAESAPVAYATSTAIDDGWVRLSVTFTAGSSSNYTVAICSEGATGAFYADDFQVELGEAPSAHNLVENGDMASNSGWTFGTGASISSGVLKISSSPSTTDALAYRDIPINLSGNQTYVLSGWATASSAPNDTSPAIISAVDTLKQFCLRAMITYSDGTTEIHNVPFETDLRDYQFISYALIPQSPSKTVSTIRVVCAYEQNVNTAQFDNISLVRETAQTLSYDSQGNLLSVKTTGQGTDQNSYSAANLLIQQTTAGYGTYYYTYGNSYSSYIVVRKHNGYVQNKYNYDTMGNIKSTTLSDISGDISRVIETSATYSTDGNRQLTATDAAGNTVTYAYGNSDSEMMGLPTSVTAPNGMVTNTTYDSQNRVTQMSIANGPKLVYNYTDGNLSSIVRTGNSISQTYTLAYDDFGNTTSIKVGDRTLATYTYNTKNGNLKKQTDGNGDTVSYTYDHLDRVKTATYSDGLVLTYVYNGEGNLYSVTATENGATTKYIYEYDSLDRLISSERRDGNASVIRARQGYDNVNRLTYQAWQMGGTTYTEGYTYNSTIDGSLNTHTTATGQTLTMGYDGLQRLSKVTGGIYGKTYTYRDVSSTKTTMQVAKVVYDLPTDQSFAYTYDSMGNIATYTDVNGTVTYTYDAQGQLTKAAGSSTYNYTYDAVGNILTGNGHSYTYGNSDWKDLLTAVDGQTISYDDIGNPTSYYNGTRWTFTWGQGRRLSSASDGTTNVSYTYDADGIRTSKTVDGVKHTYLYAGGKLLRETYGSNTLDFFYDANGYPYALKHNGTTYYYITNLQGDVMSIVNGSGAVVATYKYDPYGNVLTASGTMAEANPLRYRGYYYDTESGLYYLQSRYYDPKIGRFINADALVSTGQGVLGNNMFAYCLNNPINYLDNKGKDPIAISAGVVILGVVVAVLLVDLGAKLLAETFQQLSRQWQYAHTSISFTSDNSSQQGEANKEKRSLDTEGEPNSDDELYDDDGNLKQRRHYGPDGKAEYDIDYKHSGNFTFPHKHVWDWSAPVPRSGHIPLVK